MTSQPGPNPKSSYGHGRDFLLPDDWQPVEASMFDTALRQTEQAFTGGEDSTAHAIDHLLTYYEPKGGYAGATFLEVQPHEEYNITAADLWAVSTLSMTISPNAGRALMNPGHLHARVSNYLHHLPPALSVASTTPVHLVHMKDLYWSIKSMLPPLGKRQTNQWVLASKVCARKRPLLFPVRDSKVCTYLAQNKRMGSKPGQLGAFIRDIQVFAYLVTHPLVLQRLDEVRTDLYRQQPDWSFDWCDLRLLDAVLWMQATKTT